MDFFFFGPYKSNIKWLSNYYQDRFVTNNQNKNNDSNKSLYYKVYPSCLLDCVSNILMLTLYKG